jgi:hypothetical protein
MTTKSEHRYWERIGLRVTKEQALEFVDRVIESAGTTGKILDDDIEEFVAPEIVTSGDLLREVNDLFESPDDTDVIMSDYNSKIMELMTFESNRKQFVKDKKAEGLSLEDAKKEYDLAKAALVKEMMDIDLPEGVVMASQLENPDGVIEPVMEDFKHPRTEPADEEE